MSKAHRTAERPRLSAVRSRSTTSEISTTSQSEAAAAGAMNASATIPELGGAEAAGRPGADAATPAAPVVLRPVPALAPDPEVTERPRRRSFTADFKRRLVEEADDCREPGAIGALLRRHGLYSSHLVDWRAQYRQGALRGLTPRPRGPKPQKNPLVDRVAKLEREKARLERRLRQAETVIEVQKKLSELLGIPLSSPNSDENA
jgi:transposase